MKDIFVCAGLLLLALLTACTHPLSKEARLSVDPDAYFESAREKPEAYKGKTFLLGGIIVANRTIAQNSTLEVLSYNLDSQDKPARPNEIKGRFLAIAGSFLDPALYEKNRLVTLTGTFTGLEKHPLNGQEYTYPVFKIGEVYLWPKELDRNRYRRYRHPHYPYSPYDPFYPHLRYHPYYRYW